LRGLSVTGDRRPATGDRRPATGDRRPATGETILPKVRIPMAKTNEQILREALEKTTDLIKSVLELHDDEAIDLLGQVGEDVEDMANKVLAQTAPDPADCKHEPDWRTAYTTYDGDEEYLDVACRKCGESGCIGTTKTISAGICWENEEKGGL
jgi:hypothetical protein